MLDESHQGIVPLVFDADQDLIDGTTYKELAPTLPSPLGRALAKPDATLVKRWMALAIAITAFINGVMIALPVPMAIDFLHHRTESTVENLKYGVLFSGSPLAGLMFTLPAVWLGNLDRQYGGLSLLIVAFLLWTGSSLASACSALVSGGKRFAVMLLSRAINGLASSCASMAVVNVIGTACTDSTQRSALLLVTIIFFEVGQALSTLLSGLAALAGVDVGWQIAFCTTAALAALGGGVVAAVRHELSKYEFDAKVFLPSMHSLAELLRSPLVVILALNYFVVVVASVLASVLSPLWIRHVFHPAPVTAVVAVVLAIRPLTFLFVLFLKCFERTPAAPPRWRVVALATLSLAMAFVILTIIDSTTSHVSILVLPLSIIGFASGQVETTVFPLLVSVLDSRGVANFGELRFLHVFVLMLAYFVAPLFSTSLSSLVGFDWTFYIVAFVLACFTPFLAVLKYYEDEVHVHDVDGRR